jgi:hypothetical protein
MSASNARAAYEARFNRVTAYIYDHLDDDIDLNRLAEIACLSPYHWHRQRLARKYKAEVTCPITMGYHLRTVAEAAWEAHQRGARLSEITPFWRVLDEETPTTSRLACGPDFVVRQRRKEKIPSASG